MVQQVLFSRYADGNRPVKASTEDGGKTQRWEVPSRDGTETKVFTSAQGLLAELTGHPAGWHWSPDRYFRIGAYAPKDYGQGTILDLFQVDPSPSLEVKGPLAPSLPVILDASTAISVPAVGGRRSQGQVVVQGPVGIDLATRAHEVRKLLFAGYGRKIFSAGYDPEDVLQEVYRGILARNQGKCPWDPSKSSFGHYVHMVCGCILKNYHRKQYRIRSYEQTGMRYMHSDGYRMGDVAGATNIPATSTVEHKGQLMGEAMEDLADFILEHAVPGEREVSLAIAIIPHMYANEPRKSIAQALGVSTSSLSRAISYLRKAAIAWGQSLSDQQLVVRA